MKKIITFITFMVLSLSNNGYGQTNVPYWKEGFSASTLSTASPTATGGSYFQADAPGTWYGFNVYATTGTGCPPGNWHIRAKNISGVIDSAYLVTPIVSNGIKEFHFSRARASRSYTFYVTTDTNAVTATWTYVTLALSRATTVTCVDTTIMIDAPTAKRLKIVMRPGTDTDIDSLWLTNFSGTIPIELLSFSGENTEGSKNKLTWATASEINNKHFDIERSTDGTTFHHIGQVKGNNKPSSYQFVDAAPPSGAGGAYYRLRQIDNDGTETYSKIVSVAQTGKGKGLAVYPNPVSSLLNIEVIARNEATEGTSFQILNLLGQQVLTGKTAAQVDVSALPQGTYILKVGAEQAKFVKQ